MSIRSSDRPKLFAALIGAVAGLAAKPIWDGLNNLADGINVAPTPQKVDEATPTNEPMPYIPKTERINPDNKLPDDVIDSEDLWRSYHTRIWCGQDTKMFLRPGIAEKKLFEDLHKRRLESLDIVLFDDSCELTEEQRKYIHPELVEEFDEFVRDRGGFPTGLLLGDGYGHNADHLLESYPDATDNWVATYHTPAMIFRHEVDHYNYVNFSSSPEEMVGMDLVEEMLSAQKLREKSGDDSGYFVVYEIKEGVVIS